jgi:hypothetical protein
MTDVHLDCLGSQILVDPLGRQPRFQLLLDDGTEGLTATGPARWAYIRKDAESIVARG